MGTFLRSAAALLAATASLTLAAAEPAPATEAPATLDPIETVGVTTRLERPIDEVVGTVDVIGSTELEARAARGAADLVRYVPGVSVEGAGTRFGDLGFTIRGMGGDRVRVEVDGVPRHDHFAVGAFANATRDALDPELVRRIEILRGPASTLYGSDALGGVVAITTKDPGDLLDGGARFGGVVRALHASADDSAALSALAAIGSADRGLLLVASNAEGAAVDRATAATVPDDPQDWWRRGALAKGVWEGDGGDRWSLAIEQEREQVLTDVRSLLGRGRFTTTTTLEGDDRQRREAWVGQWRFRGRFGLEHGVVRAWDQRTGFDQRTVQVRLLAAPQTREERRFRYQQDGLGLTGDFEWQGAAFGVEQRLGFGVSVQRIATSERRDGLRYNLTAGTVGNVILGETFPVRDFPDSSSDLVGLWAQDELRFGRLTLLPGVRWDYSHLDPDPDAIYRADNPGTTPTPLTDQAVSPKLGAQWAATDELDLFLQYAHGFRAPPFEDVNIGLDIPLFGYRAIPNPELEPERSDGVELGMRWLAPRSRAELVLFQTDYRDLIESRVNLGLDPGLGLTIFQSQNRARARVRGVEARARHGTDGPAGTWLELHGALAWTEGVDRDSGAPLNGVDPAELVLGASLSGAARRWTVELIGTAVDGKDEADAAPGVTPFLPPGYAVFDLFLNLRPNDRLSVTLGVHNLADRAHWRWGAVRGFAADDPVVDLLAASGRSATLSLRLPF